MYWCFVTINGRLGEIYFNRKKNDKIKFLGHCFVKRSDFKIKEELCVFNRETKKFKIIYKNKKYKILIKGTDASK